MTPDEILKLFFRRLKENNIGLLVLDEFTFLVRDFSKRKPYRGAEKVIAHLRGLIDEYEGSVLFTASSLWFIAKMLKGYERRLAKMFDVVMKLDSLTIQDSSMIAYDITKDRERSFIIANLGDGVPYYVESISLTNLRVVDPYESFREELTRGALNELFRALFNDLMPAAKEVIFLLSKGPKTYEGLEKEILDKTMPYALDYLQEMDLIGRIERRRRTTYYLKDKTFGAWLTLNRKPEVSREIGKITKILSIGFEAIVRELFLGMTTEVVIRDAKGDEIEFGPTDYVKRVELDGEIDLLARDLNDRYIVGEITIRKEPARKIAQLDKNVVKLSEKMGIKEIFKLLITYNKPSEELLELAKEKGIFVLSSRELNELAKKLNYRPI